MFETYALHFSLLREEALSAILNATCDAVVQLDNEKKVVASSPKLEAGPDHPSSEWGRHDDRSFPRRIGATLQVINAYTVCVRPLAARTAETRTAGKHACMYVCAYVSLSHSLYLYIYIYVLHTHICICVYSHMFIYIHMYTCMYNYMHICICIHINTQHLHVIHIYPEVPTVPLNGTGHIFVIRFPFVLVLYSVVCTIDVGVVVVGGFIDMLFICTCV